MSCFQRLRLRRISLLVLGSWVFIAIQSAGVLGVGERHRGPALLAAGFEEDLPYVAPYVPTPQEVVDRMLELAEVGKGDVVYDLGSGDGRIVIAAARKYGVRAVGFEIDPMLVKLARDNVREAGVEHLVEIREENLETADFAAATVVTLYLYPAANLRLRPTLRRQLKPGSRIVSHQFAMGGWQADQTVRMIDSTGILRTIYLWHIAKHSGRPGPFHAAGRYALLMRESEE